MHDVLFRAHNRKLEEALHKGHSENKMSVTRRVTRAICAACRLVVAADVRWVANYHVVSAPEDFLQLRCVLRLVDMRDVLSHAVGVKQHRRPVARQRPMQEAVPGCEMKTQCW